MRSKHVVTRAVLLTRFGMVRFDPATSFGPDASQRYDDDFRGDEVETVDFLAGLGGSGPVLEFAIGTGRVAVPLGVLVDGLCIVGFRDRHLPSEGEERRRPQPDEDAETLGVGGIP